MTMNQHFNRLFLRSLPNQALARLDGPMLNDLVLSIKALAVSLDVDDAVLPSLLSRAFDNSPAFDMPPNVALMLAYMLAIHALYDVTPTDLDVMIEKLSRP